MPTDVQYVRAVLATTPTRWLALADTIPTDLLSRAPFPGEWSALDCLCHILATEREVFPVRVRAFLAGQDLPAYDPDAAGALDGDGTPAQVAAELAGIRPFSLALLDGLTAEDMERTAYHAELGPVTLGEMLHEWAAHDLMHTVQGERALMQPFIVRSGAWRGYFRDHEVAGQA